MGPISSSDLTNFPLFCFLCFGYILKEVYIYIYFIPLIAFNFKLLLCLCMVLEKSETSDYDFRQLLKFIEAILLYCLI